MEYLKMRRILASNINFVSYNVIESIRLPY